MKKILSLIACIITVAGIHAQDCVKHTVNRGETLEYIAGLYGTTTARIIELNPEAATVIYTGMELDMPETDRTRSLPQTGINVDSSLGLTERLKVLQAMEAECAEADRLLDAQEYGKASKAYSKIIKKYDTGIYPCTIAYYGRGLAHYNQGKWKNAINDFEQVTADPRCDSEVRSHSTELLAKAREYRDEQLNERAEMWGALVATAITTTTAAVVANQQAKAANRSGSYGLTSSSGSSYSDSGGSTDYADSNGSNMSSSTSSSSNTCPSLNVSHGKYYCANTGKCGMCGGDGLMDGSFGQGPNSHKCTLCGGSGRCKYCNK